MGSIPYTPELCDNCVKKGTVECNEPTISACSNYEPIVAIPEWVAKAVKGYAKDYHDGLEEGYDQAIEDILDWWSGMMNSPYITGNVRTAVRHLLDVIFDKKKERFGPEPPATDRVQRLGDFTNIELMEELQGRIEK